MIKFLGTLFLSLAVSANLFAGDLTSVTGLWKLDEASNSTRNDSSANANHLTDTNSNVAATTGQFSNAANFDSSTDYLTRNDGSWTGEINFTSGNYTVGAWVNFTNVGSNIRAMCGKRSGPGAGWEFGHNSSNKMVTYQGTTAITDTGTALSTSTNTHMAMVFNDSANTVDFYRDGSSNSQVTSVTTNPTSQTSNFRISQDASNIRWTGWVDELFIFSRALSGAEISDLKTNGIAAFMTTTTSSQVSGYGVSGVFQMAFVTFACFNYYSLVNAHRIKFGLDRPEWMKTLSPILTLRAKPSTKHFYDMRENHAKQS